MHLGGDFWPKSSKVTNDEQVELIKPFEEEIQNIIKDLKENSALGPNGFGPSFFKKCWEMCQLVLLNMF